MSDPDEPLDYFDRPSASSRLPAVAPAPWGQLPAPPGGALAAPPTDPGPLSPGSAVSHPPSSSRAMLLQVAEVELLQDSLTGMEPRAVQRMIEVGWRGSAGG